MSNTYMSLKMWSTAPLTEKAKRKAEAYQAYITRLNNWIEGQADKIVENIVVSKTIGDIKILSMYADLKRGSKMHLSTRLMAGQVELSYRVRCIWQASKFSHIEIMADTEEEMILLKQIDEANHVKVKAYHHGETTCYRGGAITCSAYFALHKYLMLSNFGNMMKHGQDIVNVEPKSEFRT